MMLASGSDAIMSKQVIHLQPLAVQYLINYMRYKILYYKIGFVLDDFCPVLGSCKCSEYV